MSRMKHGEALLSAAVPAMAENSFVKSVLPSSGAQDLAAVADVPPFAVMSAVLHDRYSSHVFAPYLWSLVLLNARFVLKLQDPTFMACATIQSVVKVLSASVIVYFVDYLVIYCIV